jgi:hypothetical protein
LALKFSCTASRLLSSVILVSKINGDEDLHRLCLAISDVPMYEQQKSRSCACRFINCWRTDENMFSDIYEATDGK